MPSDARVPRLELGSGSGVQLVPMNPSDDLLISKNADANADRVLSKGEYDRFVAQAQAVRLSVPVRSALDAAFSGNPPPTVRIKAAADLCEAKEKATIPGMLFFTAAAVVLTPFTVLLDVITLPAPKAPDRSVFSATEGLWGTMAKGWEEATGETI